jgi:hypothetical protein
MPYPLWNNIPQRYARSFDVADVNFTASPFFFMKANTTGVAGQVLQYDTTEDYVTTAQSGVKAYAVAGILMQDIKDLDGGAVKGYRNLNNTVDNLGANVLVAQGNFVGFTKTYVGTVALGNRLQVSAVTPGYLAAYAATNTGDVLGVVEAVSSSTTPTIEPQQLASGSTGNDFIRVRFSLGL